MKFNTGDKVHLLNSKITETGTDVHYGNRGVVTSTNRDIVTGIETYEVFFAYANFSIIVSPEDIDFYNQPHLSSVFSIENQNGFN